MRAVGIKVLKNRLSEYVRMASQGETILVTDRDRVVAELVRPSGRARVSARDALLEDLVREGLLTPAPLKGIPLPPRKPMMKLEDLLRELDESRADRWST